MPVEVQCSHCGKKLRAPETHVGKKAKCPACKKAFELRPITASAPAGAGSWTVQTDDGQQFGPIAREELDAWVSEGRLDAQCQLLCDGWDQWKWADEVYPELNQPEAPPAPLAVGNPKAAAPLAVGRPEQAASPFPAPALKPRADNPFAAPQLGSHEAGADDDSMIPHRVCRALIETRPPVLTLAILLFVFAAISLLGGVMAGVAAGNSLMLVVQMIAAGVYGLFGFLLLQYSNAIGSFRRQVGPRTLQRAIESQKTIWKIAAIVAIIFICVTIVFTVVSVITVVNIRRQFG